MSGGAIVRGWKGNPLNSQERNVQGDVGRQILKKPLPKHRNKKKVYGDCKSEEYTGSNCPKIPCEKRLIRKKGAQRREIKKEWMSKALLGKSSTKSRRKP